MIKINKRIIDDNSPVYIVAELSANHNQDLKIALESIEAIKETGADAVKIQTYTPDSMTLDSDKPWFQTRKDSLWAGQKLYDLYKKGYTPWEWHIQLKEKAESLGLDFFSTPFDVDSVNKLESISIPAYKIASLEITDINLIRTAAKTGKPIIISTGAAELEDIQLAVDTCKENGNDKIILLKCTSAYPTPFNEVNLRSIFSLKEEFDLVVGLSDHTLGISVPVAAAALGAKMIEKHFILDKSIDTLDKEFSLEPADFRDMVKAVRQTEESLGDEGFVVSEKSKQARASLRSLFVIKDIKKDELLTEENVRSLRPKLGLHPKHLREILGKKAKQDIKRGTPLTWDLLK